MPDSRSGSIASIEECCRTGSSIGEYATTRFVHACAEAHFFGCEYELDYVRDTLRKLLNLVSGGRVQDCKSGIDVPLVGENA